jgi:hypothetical protein
MNKIFIEKMMQAKCLQYEALKEIMPEKMVNRIRSIENELIDIGKECIANIMANSANNKAASETKTGVRKLRIE